MKKTKQMLALGFMLITLLFNPLISSAQPAQLVDTGTVVSNINFTDIHGEAFTLYDYLDEGYTVIIELGLTTCPLCWNFSQTGTFDRLYEQYGPEGEVTPKKILPMYIECNPGTTDADLRGTGSNTQGDWVTGHDYPIIDLTRENLQSTLSNFFVSGTLGFTTPTFLIICPDRKVAYTGLGQFAVNESMAKTFMEGRCASAVGVETIQNSINAAAVVLYPNPVTNLFGQVVQEEEVALQQGEQIWSMTTERLASGFYLFSVTTDQGTIARQFIKK